MLRHPSKLDVFKLFALWTNLPLIALGLILGLWSYGTSSFEGAAILSESIFGWLFIVYAAAFVLIYAVFAFSPIVLVLHGICSVFVVPDRVDELGAALCEEVATQGIVYRPDRGPLPGPYFAAGRQLTFFRDNQLWRGQCSYVAGSYGANRGPYGEEFFLHFYRGPEREPFVRLSLEFNLRDNLLDMIPVWLSDPSHPLMLKNNSIKPYIWDLEPEYWQGR